MTIPANADANIATIKSHDKSRVGVPVVRLSAPTEKEPEMTLAERLKALAKKRAERQARKKALMDGADADGGRTLNAEETKEYDEIDGELAALDAHEDQAGKTVAELQRMRAAEFGVGEAAEQYIAQIEKANAATGHLAHGAGGARREMLVLAHEASQGNWKNFGGSLMVLGEQMDILKYLLNPVALGIAAVAAASYVAYEAVHKLTEQQKEINGAMVLTSNYADLSQGSLLAYSNTISKDLKVSTGTASEALLDMAKSGMVAGADLVQVSEGIVAYSKISGQSVSDVPRWRSRSRTMPARR